MARRKEVKTADDFIDEVNRCKSGRYDIGYDIAEISEPLRAYIHFDSAKWEYQPEVSGRTLLLYSQETGREKGCVRVNAVQGVEHIRQGEKGNTYAIIVGENGDKRYFFRLDNPTN